MSIEARIQAQETARTMAEVAGKDHHVFEIDGGLAYKIQAADEEVPEGGVLIYATVGFSDGFGLDLTSPVRPCAKNLVRALDTQE